MIAYPMLFSIDENAPGVQRRTVGPQHGGLPLREPETLRYVRHEDYLTSAFQNLRPQLLTLEVPSNWATMHYMGNSIYPNYLEFSSLLTIIIPELALSGHDTPARIFPPSLKSLTIIYASSTEFVAAMVLAARLSFPKLENVHAHVIYLSEYWSEDIWIQRGKGLTSLPANRKTRRAGKIPIITSFECANLTVYIYRDGSKCLSDLLSKTPSCN
jgi:hypothetical protein